MERDQQLNRMQAYCANVAITASALRKQGDSGLVELARRFLGDLPLAPLRTLGPPNYPHWLNDQTNALAELFREKHAHWGSARKSINIFMTMAALNRFLCSAYELERFEHVMEVPLDSVVMGDLRQWEKDHAAAITLPAVSITDLEPETSCKFQNVAAKRADALGVPRGRLDAMLWKPTK